MARMMTLYVLLIGLSATVAVEAAANPQFIFTVPFRDGLDSTLDPGILVSSNSDSTGTIANFSGTFSQQFFVPANDTAIVPIPVTLTTSLLINTDAAFSITTDQPVAAYLLNAIVPDASNDLTRLLPVSSLGMNYRMMASSVGPLFTTFTQAQLSIVATEDNTLVDIIPSALIIRNDLGLAFSTTSPFQITLDRGQSVRYVNVNTGELTGTKITADKPIGVYGGSVGALVPIDVPFKDYIVEQMIPIDDWGTEHVIVPTARPNSPGDEVRVLADQDGTIVTVTGSTGNTVHNLNAGEFLQLSTGQFVNELTSITSNLPVMVGQFMVGSDLFGINSGIGDPAFSLVPDVNSWLDEYIFHVPTGYVEDYFNVAIEAATLSSLLLDGVAVDPTLFDPIPGTTLVGGNILVSDGTHIVTADDPFMMLGHGWDNNFASYFGVATAPAVIPEPASAVLLGLGGLMLMRRRRM